MRKIKGSHFDYFFSPGIFWALDNYLFRKILGLEKFWVLKIFAPAKFGSQKILDFEKFRDFDQPQTQLQAMLVWLKDLTITVKISLNEYLLLLS